jgi:hypothetical protein
LISENSDEGIDDLQLIVSEAVPSPLDYQASEVIMPLLDEVHVGREDLRAFLVVNCKPPSKTRVSADAREAAKALFTTESFSVGILETELHTRTAYVEAPRCTAPGSSGGGSRRSWSSFGASGTPMRSNSCGFPSKYLLACWREGGGKYSRIFLGDPAQFRFDWAAETAEGGQEGARVG